MEILPTDELTNRSIRFTKSQQLAINDLLDFIAKDFNPADYIHGLIGKGGTGKTYIINYIIVKYRRESEAYYIVNMPI